MNDYPLIVFVALLLAQSLAEFAAMLRTGTLRRKHKREWTYCTVAIPFKATLGVAILEHLYLGTHPTAPMVVVGALAAIAATVIRVVGHFQLAGAFSQYVEKREGQRLIQSGLYATIRHPMYIGSILLFLGMPLVLAARWAWICAALGLVGIFLRIHKEEAFLTRELPGYREYKEKTWRLIPHIY